MTLWSRVAVAWGNCMKRTTVSRAGWCWAIVGLVFFFLSGAASAVEIANPYFHLDMPGDWLQQPTSDPDQFVITSESRKAQLTISYVPMNAKGRDLKQIGNKLLEFRFSAEQEVAGDRGLVFSDPWGTEHPDGTIQVNYLGHDTLGRHFFFSGFVTETHTTSVTGELEQSSEPALHDFFQEVLSHFGY